MFKAVRPCATILESLRGATSSKMRPPLCFIRLAVVLGGIASSSVIESDGPYAARFPIDQVGLPILNGNESANPHSLSSLFGRQGEIDFLADGSR